MTALVKREQSVYSSDKPLRPCKWCSFNRSSYHRFFTTYLKGFTVSNFFDIKEVLTFAHENSHFPSGILENINDHSYQNHRAFIAENCLETESWIVMAMKLLIRTNTNALYHIISYHEKWWVWEASSPAAASSRAAVSSTYSKSNSNSNDIIRS